MIIYDINGKMSKSHDTRDEKKTHAHTYTHIAFTDASDLDWLMPQPSGSWMLTNFLFYIITVHKERLGNES